MVPKSPNLNPKMVSKSTNLNLVPEVGYTILLEPPVDDLSIYTRLWEPPLDDLSIYTRLLEPPVDDFLNPNLVSKSKNQNPKRQNEVPCTFAVKGVHTSGNHHKSIPHRCHVSTCRQDPMLFFPAGGSVCVSLRRHVMRCLA